MTAIGGRSLPRTATRLGHSMSLIVKRNRLVKEERHSPIHSSDYRKSLQASSDKSSRALAFLNT